MNDVEFLDDLAQREADNGKVFVTCREWMRLNGLYLGWDIPTPGWATAFIHEAVIRSYVDHARVRLVKERLAS